MEEDEGLITKTPLPSVMGFLESHGMYPQHSQSDAEVIPDFPAPVPQPPALYHHRK